METRINSADELDLYEEVGRGGFGVVYRGVVKATGKEVAVKQIDLENENADLFEVNKEIQILSESKHPYITRFYGCFVRHFQLWVIMEYVDGGSLFDLLRPGPITDEKAILVVLKEVLLALQYLHEQGKIHRDLKSQNILVNYEGEIKLTDFGVSTQLSSNFSRRNTTVGTPYWMAPEVILNDNGGHSFKADIWSLGCCAFELFTGKPPLQSQVPPMKALRQISRCSRDEDFISLIELEDLNISTYFKDFLCSCFIVDPKARSSAKQLLKHKFITKSSSSEEESQRTLKKIITNKRLWDQKNRTPKEQKFYVPTEIKENQQKWKGEAVKDAPEFHFDISVIQGTSSIRSPLSPRKDTNNKNMSISNDKDRDAWLKSQAQKEDSITKAMEPELRRVLNKVFHKLDSKNLLSTQQYDSLVSLNECMLNLLTVVRETDTSRSYKRVLLCQYLKYFLKEVSKQNMDKTTETEGKQLLQKAIMPSNIKLSSSSTKNVLELFTLRQTPMPLSTFDEIELSLMETWVDNMKNT